ncbi:MAG: hypothetical protein ABSH21_08845 [Verrucomicrobiia bacterium]|jgi:hypothetical protein
MNLTERRLEKAKPILEKYRTQLHGSGRIVAGWLEQELKDCWGCSYKGLKTIFIQLSKITRYRYLAAYYMKKDAPAIVEEFKPVLAGLYGIDDYDSPDRERKQKAFWQEFKALRERGSNGHDTT